MSRRRASNPAEGTIRSRRSRELEALGHVTDRITYDADGLRLLVAGGYMPDRIASDCSRHARATRAQAVSDFLAVALSVLDAELMQHVPNAASVTGYSLRKRRD